MLPEVQVFHVPHNIYTPDSNILYVPNHRSELKQNTTLHERKRILLVAAFCRELV